jgi:chemotaxis protein MotA
MDLATIIGIIAGTGLIVWGMSSGGQGVAGLLLFFDVPSMLIVIGGSSAALLVNFPLSQVLGTSKVIKNVFSNQHQNPNEMIGTMVSFAEKARREGLLTLEDEANDLKDEFLKKGIQLVVDGTDPDLVRDILEIELTFLEDRHRLGKAVLEALGTFAPAFGMIGTLIGLIQMLANLDDPNSIGSGMAVALITTFYGALLANFIFLPMAGKLGVRSSEEMLFRQVIVEGVLAIQNGENPRIVQEKLRSFFAPKMRLAPAQEES